MNARTSMLLFWSDKYRRHWFNYYNEMILLKEMNNIFILITVVNLKVNSSRNFLSYEIRKFISFQEGSHKSSWILYWFQLSFLCALMSMCWEKTQAKTATKNSYCILVKLFVLEISQEENAFISVSSPEFMDSRIVQIAIRGLFRK